MVSRRKFFLLVFAWPKVGKFKVIGLDFVWNIEWAEHEITFRRRLKSMNVCDVMWCGEPMSQRMKPNLYVCIWTCVSVFCFSMRVFVYCVLCTECTINTCNYGRHAKIQMWMRTFCGNSVCCAFQFKMQKPFGFECLLLQMNIKICSYENEYENCTIFSSSRLNIRVQFSDRLFSKLLW